ncbi:MAG: hypothetical protein ABIL62_03880, partial [Planctomycetota bacterium]
GRAVDMWTTEVRRLPTYPQRLRRRRPPLYHASQRVLEKATPFSITQRKQYCIALLMITSGSGKVCKSIAPITLW